KLVKLTHLKKAPCEESMNQNEVPVGSTSSQSQPDLRKEIMEYLIRSREPMKSNPLDFWKNNSKEFPLLSKAARRYLSFPATSVASEELFSTARDVYSYRRMRIRPRKAEIVIFLNRNLPLFNYKY
uniref:HAT C-terminal dimerisation domain-containing protein n=1 Tax=Acrobeloides nanus TaxID=290746 RepID=A0A914DDN6_9BILA